MGGDVAVVEARVALLHGGVGQPGASLQKELVDLDVGWQSAGPERFGIGQVRPGREQPIDNRAAEAPFEIAAKDGPHQGEAREDPEPQTAVGLGQAVEGVDQRVRLADPDRDADVDLAADAIDDRLRTAHRIVEVPAHSRSCPGCMA